MSIGDKSVAKPVRESGIELLRILAACAVVMLHFNGMGGALSSSSGITHELLLMLESLCIGAVDVFIIISGFFLCATMKRTWDKPVYLFFLLSIINVAAFSLKTIIDGDSLDILHVIHCVFPPQNYFFVLYVTLYIVSPFINLVLNSLSNDGRTTFIIVLFAIFSIYSFLMDSYQLLVYKKIIGIEEIVGVNPVGAWGSQLGYTIVGFTLCYSIGAWARLNKVFEYLTRWKWMAYSTICILLIYFLCKVESYYYGSFDNALSYTNPFVVLLSLSFVMLFAKMNFRSRIINSLAKAAFVCYVFHYRIFPYLDISNYARSGGLHLFLYYLVLVVAIYFVSWFIWFVLDWVLKPIVRKLGRYELFSLAKTDGH